MRTLLKVLGIIGIVVLMLVVVVASYGAWTVRRSYPQLDGTIHLAGLSGSVDVVRNERGITDLYADTPADLFFAQGYVHAQDRFWEMDFRRHITAGRLAEMFGKDQVDTDKFLRVSGWYRVAQQELPLLSAQTRANLDAYTKGVNAYLADHSGATASLEYAILGLQTSYTIEPWTDVDSLSWLKAMAWDLAGNLDDESARSVISSQVGVDRTAQLYPPYPYDRHQPIVTTGALVAGVYDPTATPPTAQAAARAPHLPAGATAALAALHTAMGSVQGVLGPIGRGIGSNSWVVSGKLTDTGKPLLANDPHLAAQMPSIWYQMGLHCRVVSPSCPYDVSGFTFSGVPGVVIGHNARIGWGFTNLGPDVTDLVLEKVTGDTYEVGGKQLPLTTHEETIKVAGGDDVHIMVRETKDGPLVSDASTDLTTVGADAPVTGSAPDRGSGYAVALKWTALTPGRTMDALTALDTAQDFSQFRAAAQLFEVPAQNMIYADVDGNIGYQTPGRIPIRSGYDGTYPAFGWDPKQTWIGYIPLDALPYEYNPPAGFVVTANNASVYPQYPYFITSDWSYGARSQRIVDLVRADTSSGRTMTADDMRAIQMDTRNENASFLVPKIRGTKVADELTTKAMTLFDGWDYTQPTSNEITDPRPLTSAAAAYFNAFWHHLLVDVFGDEIPKDYWPDGEDRWFEVVRQLWDKPNDPWWDDVRTTDKVETRDDAVAKALQEGAAELADRIGDDPTTWSWGQLHTLTVTNQTLGESGIGAIERLFNRGPVATAGGPSIVDATGWDAAGDGYEVDWVPSMRMVLDLSDLDRSTWVNLTGNSGHAYNRNYSDQLDAWVTGTTYPFAFSKAAVEAAATDHLTLSP